MKIKELKKEALGVLSNSYSPYSGFRVGAALLAESGEIYVGTNVENASYSVTMCAERVALFKAISVGERNFGAILIVGEDEGGAYSLSPPCGPCRQVLAEFEHNMDVYLMNENQEIKNYQLKKLLPNRFEL